MPPKSRAVPIPHVGLNDEFSSDFINALLALPNADASSDSSTPPSKKIKLSHDASESYQISHHKLVVTRRCDASSCLPASTARRDVGTRVRLSLGHGGKSLYITLPLQGRSSRTCRITVALPSGLISKELETCFLVHEAKENKQDEGTIWVSVEIHLDPCGKSVQITFCFDLFWNATLSPYRLRSKSQRKLSDRVLSVFFPDTQDRADDKTGWTPLDFYEAAFVPPSNDDLPLSIEIPDLDAELYPYQKRTLQWLLKREGVAWTQTNDGSTRRVQEWQTEDNSVAARSFIETNSPSFRQLYFSRLYHALTTATSPFRDAESSIKGGILAEEMGLGKTLEIIGLVLLHQRPMRHEAPFVNSFGENLVRSGATLIVCPESLRQQWMAELGKHAPHLLVSFYPGRGHMGDSHNGVADEDELVAQLAHQDVVVTTYPILSAETHYAQKPPERSRRRERVHPRPKSPLIQISWWRVCLDEAQMIESGVSSAALIARVLHRVNAWGITGTPVKSDVKDLLGLLLFLRYEPYSSAPQVWAALTDHHKSLFRGLFSDIAIRHTKRMVRDELELPPQKRFIITIPFTAVEDQHYRSLVNDMAEECGVDVDGNPVVDDWSPESYEESMRSWLNRLRQTALHPEVGVQNRRALGHKAGPLRTVDEVLSAMIEQNELAIRIEQRAYFNARLTHGQMLENSPRVKEALSIWESVRSEADVNVKNLRQELQKALQEAKSGSISTSRQESSSGRGDDDVDADADDDLVNSRVGDARMRLRMALEILHKAAFFCANGHFQIKTNTDWTAPESDEFHALQRLEDDGYETAKSIRREILAETHKKATKHMKKLQNMASSQSFVAIPELTPNPLKGIESSAMLDRVEELYDILNRQANQIDEWREAIVQLLVRPLIDEEDETEITGDEFADSTKIQEHLMVHVQLLRAIVVDRQDAISGLKNTLVSHELGTAKAAARQDDGPAPAKFLELLKLRDALKPSLDEHVSLRGTISELRALLVRLPRPDSDGESRGKLEYELVSRQIKDIQEQVLAQSKATQALERESDRFTSAMNARLEYYRQLQAVSDSVEPYEGPIHEQVIANCIIQEESCHKKFISAEGKHRYLWSLRDTGPQSSDPRICIICQSEFTTGVLTVCGHEYCKECLMLWYRAHRNCPLCKRTLKMSDLHNITLKPREPKLHTEDFSAHENRHSPTSKKTGIYSSFSSEKLAEINNIELHGPSFTTKVDSIVRHILWLRESDPGAKSIIFSQYRDFLSVLGTAFSQFHIAFTSIDRPQGIQRFKEEAGIEVFLLHGRAHSSGLNLVNASHVFLCEPVLNTALELQAIARVDRIGQQHETTVWLYLIEGTVEESIYNLSAKRRMDHMGRGRNKDKSKESTPEVAEPTLEAANTLEMEQAALSKLMSKDKSAGEAVDKNDLWECLFGHVARANEAEANERRLEENPAIRGFLAAEAAEERRRGEANGTA